MSRRLGSKWEVRVSEQEDSVGSYLGEIEEGRKDSTGLFTIEQPVDAGISRNR